MPKLKTKKSVIKKFKVTKSKKVLHRGVGQNHFNSKENGNQGRKKKKDVELFPADAKNILKAFIK